MAFREGLPRSIHDVMGLVHTGHGNDDGPLGDGSGNGEGGSNAAARADGSISVPSLDALELGHGPVECQRRAFRTRVASLLARVSQEALARSVTSEISCISRASALVIILPCMLLARPACVLERVLRTCRMNVPPNVTVLRKI